MVNFSRAWSRPFRFVCGVDNPNVFSKLSCKGKAGIYVFTNEYDSQVLYVGKAEGTSVDICDRLRSHVTDKGNDGIGDLSTHGETFIIRWAECRNPAFSESVAIILLQPLFSKRLEWAVDRRSIDMQVPSADQCVWEAQRLGLFPSEVDYYNNLVKNLCQALGFDIGQNRCLKEELCEKAESYKNSTDWKATSEVLKALQGQWKKVGSAGREIDDYLWNRFKNAVNQFYERRQNYFQQLEYAQQENKKKKENIIREAESLSYSSDWKTTGEAFKKLAAQWKIIGSAGKEHENELWESFRQAQDIFFTQKNNFFQDNLRKKEKLVNAAENLTNNQITAIVTGKIDIGDVSVAIQRVKELQAEWKTIGSVPKDDADRLWYRFKKACDCVFASAEEERKRKQNEWRCKMLELLKRKREQAEKLRDSIEHDRDVLGRAEDSYYNVRPGSRAEEIRASLRDKRAALEEKIRSKRTRLDELEGSIRDIQSKL
ncbi:DUF349 domain-containing protein [Nostoc sp. LPT]|uniref:DUF349 domain-containing protein n=1 Tax=Nostoc sp. LPT TaxID=2815387 RepID=UPI001D3A56C3|nr:DUF349 domain-containing protein [Nostoc sp. LPT]MBN4003927.1 DUF349 domain-containing protein [Nostoc sp. LPT]